MKILLTLLILTFSNLVFAQTDSTRTPNTFNRWWERTSYIPKIAYSYQEGHFVEIGLNRGKVSTSPVMNLGFNGVFVATDVKVDFEKFMLSPKIGYETHVLFLAGKIAITPYTDFNNIDLRLTPEVGLTFLGYVNLFYGYNVKLNQNDFNLVNEHKFTLGINFILE